MPVHLGAQKRKYVEYVKIGPRGEDSRKRLSTPSTGSQKAIRDTFNTYYNFFVGALSSASLGPGLHVRGRTRAIKKRTTGKAWERRVDRPVHNMTLAFALRCVAVCIIVALHCERSNVSPQDCYATKRSPPQG